MAKNNMQFFTLAACAAFSLLPLTAAQAQTQAMTPNTVTVTGTAIIKAAPDTAIISVNLTSADKNATAALQANKDTMAHVMEILRPFNIPAGQAAASNLNINNTRGAAALLAGQNQPAAGNYQVNDRITIHVEDLSKVQPIIDAVVQAGGVLSVTTQFDVKDRTALEDKAKLQAVANARHEADVLAAAEGVKVDKVIAVSSNAATAILNALNLNLMAGGVLQDGQVAISQQVTVEYGLQ